MGRNIKEGLSYFPLDVDFFEDDKVQFISLRFGLKGDAILMRLLCKIYRQGFAFEFNEDVALLFARSVGDISLHGLVNDVVNECLKRGFFDESIFRRFGLLTSKGIQKRYIKICTDSKRINWQIPVQFYLLQNKKAKTPEEIDKTPEEMPKTPEESTQSKVKKSKEKESKEEKPPPYFSKNERQPVIPTKNEVAECFIQNNGTIEMAKKFYAKHSALGWYLNNNPIVNFRTLVYSFIEKWHINEGLTPEGKKQFQQ
jgi:hypothetical protein